MAKSAQKTMFFQWFSNVFSNVLFCKRIFMNILFPKNNIYEYSFLLKKQYLWNSFIVKWYGYIYLYRHKQYRSASICKSDAGNVDSKANKNIRIDVYICINIGTHMYTNCYPWRRAGSSTLRLEHLSGIRLPANPPCSLLGRSSTRSVFFFFFSVGLPCRRPWLIVPLYVG